MRKEFVEKEEIFYPQNKKVEDIGHEIGR